MRIIDSGFIYDGRQAPTYKRSCAFTTIALLHDGTVLVAARWGSDRDSLDGHECIFASADRGETWELRYDGYGKGAWDGVPGEVKSVAMVERVPGVVVATGLWVDRSNSDLPFINPATQGLLPMRIFHTASRDGGHTWEPRRQMHTAPHLGASPSSSAIIQLPDGGLAQPYEHWKEYDDPNPGQPAARLRFSHDGGETWPEFATVAAHPENGFYYWDERLAVHPETGQMVAMFWTHDVQAQMDIDVHIGWGSPDGRMWSAPEATGLPGQHCQPLALGGDRLLAVYSRRRERPGIGASLSEDFGRTWEREMDLTIYDSAEGLESGAEGERDQAELWEDMEAWRFGHPRAVLLPDGEVLVAFYGGSDQVKSARWARVAVGGE